MIKYLLLLVIAGCATTETRSTLRRSPISKDPETKIINQSKDPINATDIMNLEQAKKGCKRKHGPSHYLSKFIKKGPQKYRAMCRDIKYKDLKDEDLTGDDGTTWVYNLISKRIT